MLGGFLGAGDPSPSDLLQHGNVCATVCLWGLAVGRPCMLLGFALAGYAVVQLKKEGKDLFWKLLLQRAQFTSFQRWGFLTVSLPFCSLCSEISTEIVIFLKGTLSCWENFFNTL